MVLSLVQGVAKWTKESVFKRDHVPQTVFGMKKMIWCQNKTFRTNGGITRICDCYKIDSGKICNPMFWFCLLHKFAQLHTQTDSCRLICFSGVEGKVQIEKKKEKLVLIRVC